MRCKFAEVLWVVFFVVWLIWAIRTKARCRRTRGVSSRLSYTILTVAAFYLMFGGDVPRAISAGPPLPPTGFTDSPRNRHDVGWNRLRCVGQSFPGRQLEQQP